MKCHNLRILSPLSCVFKKYSGPCKKLQNDKICLNGSANSSISDKFQNDKNFVVPRKCSRTLKKKKKINTCAY